MSARDKKYLIAVMIAELVKLCFKCHIYEYGGEWFIQYEGGPIGLRLSGAVANIVMMIWDSTKLAKCYLPTSYITMMSDVRSWQIAFGIGLSVQRR